MAAEKKLERHREERRVSEAVRRERATMSHTLHSHWRRNETIDARGETENVERATTNTRVRKIVFMGENKAVSSESSVARSCAAQRRVFRLWATQ